MGMTSNIGRTRALNKETIIAGLLHDIFQIIRPASLIVEDTWTFKDNKGSIKTPRSFLQLVSDSSEILFPSLMKYLCFGLFLPRY